MSQSESDRTRRSRPQEPSPAIIRQLKGRYRFLSNFYPAAVEYEGIVYPTVEHAFQAAKTHEREDRERIAALSSPGRAKRAGRRVTLRPDWEAVKIAIMTDLVRRKFRDPALRRELLATGDALIQEGNKWGDTFWGVDLGSGRGNNHLGRVLMLVRDELGKDGMNDGMNG